MEIETLVTTAIGTAFGSIAGALMGSAYARKLANKDAEIKSTTDLIRQIYRDMSLLESKAIKVAMLPYSTNVQMRNDVLDEAHLLSTEINASSAMLDMMYVEKAEKATLAIEKYMEHLNYYLTMVRTASEPNFFLMAEEYKNDSEKFFKEVFKELLTLRNSVIEEGGEPL